MAVSYTHLDVYKRQTSSTMQNTMAKYTISFSSGMCMSSMPVWKLSLIHI